MSTNEEEKELCIKFLANPKVNPKTGKRLIKDKGPYQEYLNLCYKHGFVVGEGKYGLLYSVDKLPAFPAPLRNEPTVDITFKNKVIYSTRPVKPIIKQYQILDRLHIDTIDYFLAFPDEVIIEIFKYTKINTCISMALSNKKFYELMRSDSLWKYKYLTNFPDGLDINNKSYYDLYRLSAFLNKDNYRFTLPELYRKKIYKQEKIERTTLPIELFQLPHLQQLTYSANFIIEIPANISKLNKLVYLDLSANKISVISPEIEKLIYLKCLDLSCNELKELPLSICKLYNLISVKLKNNHIAIIPDEMTKLINLHFLELDRGVIIPKNGIGHVTIHFI